MQAKNNQIFYIEVQEFATKLETNKLKKLKYVLTYLS